MSLNIISYPETVVNDNPATVSKWVAAHHPIKFRMQRVDANVQINYFPEENRVVMVINPEDQGNAIPGDKVRLDYGGGIGEFEITFVFNTFIGLDTGQLNNVSANGTVNFLSRKNYFVRTKVWGVSASSSYFEIATMTNKPDVNGFVDVNVASFLKSIIGYSNDFGYDKLNENDPSLGGRFNITYSENWLGHEGEFSGLSSTSLRYFTNTAKQIGERYGANMGEYVPFVNYEDEDTRAKFMSDFETPTYFPGFPFSLSFIYSDSIAGTQTFKFEEQKDINELSQGIETNELAGTYGLSVNRLMLSGSYPTTTKSVDVWLSNDNTIVTEKYVADGYVAAGYVEEKTGLPQIN